jgi:hypothetical protein
MPETLVEEEQEKITDTAKPEVTSVAEGDLAEQEQIVNKASSQAETMLSRLNNVLNRLKKLLSKENDPTPMDEIEKLEEEAQRLTAATLHKISEQLGSNEGGWYEDTETNRKYYLKFYNDPDQARTEYIANAVYKQIGIRAADSQLVDMDGRLAIASEEIPGASATYREDQQKSEDVRQGFIADAYLANWDVVGLNYDNIVKDNEGHLVRVDNGGSLTYRAQGDKKQFSANNITELHSMLNNEHSSGQVFKGLTYPELEQQAIQLVMKLSEGDIDKIVKKSGLDLKTAKTLSKSLKGRRQNLVEHYHLPPVEKLRRLQMCASRLGVAFEKFLKTEGIETESNDKVTPRKRVAILADKEKIENQQIDLIDATEVGRVEICFKLTADQYALVKKYFESKSLKNKVKYNHIQYPNDITLCDDLEMDYKNTTIELSTGSNASGDVRSALGLVRLKIPCSDFKQVNLNDISNNINEIFGEVFNIPESIEPPDQKSEENYMRARYAWHNKLSTDSVANWEDIKPRLRRQQVFPEYYTVVEHGKSDEIKEKYGRFAVMHRLIDSSKLGTIIKSGGLMSTHERYRRGLKVNGMSSARDLQTGGADSVFTRIFSENAHKRDGYDFCDETTIVFKPSLLDRTDWYSYRNDNFGSTEDSSFSQRLAPHEIFKLQKREGSLTSNEQMFRTGISVSDMAMVVCSSDSTRSEIIKNLKESNINEVNGQPVEAFVVVAETGKVFDLIDESRV